MSFTDALLPGESFSLLESRSQLDQMTITESFSASSIARPLVNSFVQIRQGNANITTRSGVAVVVVRE